MTDVLTTSILFDGRELRGPSRVVVRDGIIVEIAPWDGTPEHHLLCPGFVDLQMNGFDDVDCADGDEHALTRLDDMLAAVGTTSYLATLITDHLPALDRRIEILGAASMPGCIGIHLEGPFLGTATGAHPRGRIIDPDLQWLGNLPLNVRLVTLGVESDSSIPAIEVLRDRSVVVSIGHTRPGRQQWMAAVDAGATMVTHLFNAMSGIHHREFGVALAALSDDRLVAGLIADTHHVQPDAVALAFTVKPRGICLVSDSLAWRADWALRAGVAINGGVPVLADGTLAGSSTPLAECVRRAVTVCGVELSTALRAATSTPARIVGRSDIGTIAVGQSSDIVSLDSSLGVVNTWRRLQSPRGFQTDC